VGCKSWLWVVMLCGGCPTRVSKETPAPHTGDRMGSSLRQAARSRRKFLSETAGSGKFVLPVHFPHPTTGLIEPDGERFRYRFVR
jgi:hypothetical protein